MSMLGLGTRVHPWWIHVDVWQKQYSIAKQKNKKKRKVQFTGGKQGKILNFK